MIGPHLHNSSCSVTHATLLLGLDDASIGALRRLYSISVYGYLSIYPSIYVQWPKGIPLSCVVFGSSIGGLHDA